MATNRHSARRSLRLRLLVLLLVPLLSLAALWSFAAYLTSRDALGKYEASTTYDKVATPGVMLASALQKERVAAAVFVATGGQDRRDLTPARTSTDVAQAAFRKSALSDVARRTMSGTTRRRLDGLLTQLDGLAGVRARTDARTGNTLSVINDYDAAVDSLLHLFGSVVLINDPVIYQQGTAIIDVSTANEFMMRENALITAALIRGRRLTGPEHTLFTRSADSGRYLFDRGLSNMKASLRGPLDHLATSPELATLRRLEDSIVTGGPRVSLAPKAESWRSSVTPLMME